MRELEVELLAAGRNEDVLRLSDEALDALAKGREEEDHPWAQDGIRLSRATALDRLGRGTEAMQALEQWSKLEVKGKPRRWAMLYLGSAQCSAGMGRELQATLEKTVAVVHKDDPFYRELRFCASYRVGDKAGMATELAHLREHRNEAWHPYFRALLRSNRLDEAAADFVDVLESERLRDEALYWVQDFKAIPSTGKDPEIGQREKALMARMDVKQAIDRVGYIKSFDFAGY